MQDLVRQAMEQGALGVASSLSGPPGSWIDTDTLVAMCEVASQYGGIYSTHMRTEGKGVFESVAEAIEIGRRAKRAGRYHSSQNRRAHDVGPDAGVDRDHRQARANGQQVEANVYPYRAGQNNLATIIPPWAHEGGTQAMIARLKDPALQAEPRRRSPSTAFRDRTGTTTTPRPADGKACCWSPCRIPSTSNLKASA